MFVKPQNLLVIMADEHNPKIAGYAGHPIIGTPALDTLAARGSRFTAAYTPVANLCSRSCQPRDRPTCAPSPRLGQRHRL
jgi:arylsulfatase A-like enzyme